MIKEFSDNVQKLFDETVQDKSVQSRQSAADHAEVAFVQDGLDFCRHDSVLSPPFADRRRMIITLSVL